MNSLNLTDEVVMSRAHKKLLKLNNVTEWLLEHWEHIPDNLYQKVGEEYFPYDVKEQMVELIREDFANAITPTHVWLNLKKELCDGEEKKEG